jgi:RHS repeat-associated protein
MQTSHIASGRFPAHLFVRILGCALLLMLFAAGVGAQQATDGSTPLGLSSGSPAGSYALSDFESINLYNGTLSFQMPLLKVAGRGDAGYPAMIRLEQKWIVNKQMNEPGQPWSYWAEPNWWNDDGGGMSRTYTAGGMHIRQGHSEQFDVGCNGYTVYRQTLTRLTFSAPDGTEYELRDKQTNGQPVQQSLCGSAFNRGKVFVTSDGSAATYVSDTDITDIYYNMLTDLDLYGYLLLRDGTRFRVEGGKIKWMRDRNGNKLSFTHDNLQRLTSVTDSLNRQVTIIYATTSVPYDEIRFNGFGAAVMRTIRVGQNSLGNSLRAGFSVQTAQQLFPELNASSILSHNPTVISYVELPDGRRYQFQYNSYAELARVMLPTGGAVEYDYAAGLTDGAASGVFSINFDKYVYRRVTERRFYPDGGTGTNYASKTTYSRPESTTTNDGYIVSETLSNTGARLERSRHYFYGSARASFGQKPTEYPGRQDGREYKTEVFDTNGTTLLRRIEHTFEQRAAVSWWTGAADAAPPNDPRLTQTVTTLADTGQVTKQTFSYDQYNNQTDVYEYDYAAGAAGALVRRTHTDYLTTNSINGVAYDTLNPNSSSPDISATVHLRSLPVQQKVFDADGLTERARTSYEYDNYTADAYHAALVNRPGITGMDAAFTTLNGKRGNATRVSRWLLSSATSINTYALYDIAGNVVSAIDGRGKTTTISYADSFSDGVSRNTYAFPTLTTSPIPDPTGTYGTNTALISSTMYDYSTGLVTASTDANGKTTYLDYSNDPLDRLKTVTRPAGGGTTAYHYNDVAGNLYVRTVTSLDATRSIEAYQFFDKLGRPVRSLLNEGGSPVVFITSDKQYDSLGRVWKVSNPYRTNGSNDPVNPSGNWTTTAYDALGRVKTVTSPDGAVVTTTYSGNQVTVQDQAGKARSSVTDALGRLKQVTEAPASLAYQTYYSYDVLGNLHTVAQDMPSSAQYPQGVQQRRFFLYDSLSRLIRAKNPEQSAHASLALSDPVSGNNQWSTGYTYDNNGNIATKTDARGVTATYTYDNINRNTYISYSDATPAVSRNYDGAVNGRGRFWYSFAGPSHTAIDNYDDMGRPLSVRQHFYSNGSWGNGFVTSRTHNLAGNVTSQIYPSGRSVSYAYDAAGRTNSFTGNLGDGVARNYAISIEYDEWSGLRREQFGTDIPLYHKERRNVRGQTYDMRLSTVNDTENWNRGAIVNYYSFQPYGFGTSGPDNNGNLLVQQHWVPNDDAISGYSFMQQNYGYDALNRLDWVGEYQNGATGTGSQSYAYDRYGNGTISAASGTGINGQQFAVDAHTNRLGVPSGVGGVMQYDSSGNLTNDTYSGSGTRTYDAENRMLTATNYSSQQSTYTYDADGKRVRRKSYGQETWQVYGIDGELLAEYAANAAPSTPQKEYGYRNGQLLVIADDAANAVSDFSAIQNNGEWKYGYKTLSGSTFNAFASNANLFGGGLDSWSPGYCCPMITRNATGTTYTYPGAPSVVQPSDVLNLHPGPSGEKSVVRWTASTAGTYTISGRFQGIDTAGTTTDVTILHNTTAVFSSNVNGYGNQVTFSVTRTVAAGDTIDFQVGYGSNNSYGSDSTGLAATITPQSGANVQWLFADQLGTPRMTADRTGSLAGIRRHDYLPFSEELFAGTGGRTTSQGYVVDNVRQKFTGKERDNETGLDYFGARYYANRQGRFTSPDPLLGSGRIVNPQTWNRYGYVLGNPLKFCDPLGLFEYLPGTSQDDIKRINKAYDALVAARSKYKVGSQEYEAINKSLIALGAPGQKNNVFVGVDNGQNTPGATYSSPEYVNDKVSGSQSVITLKLNAFTNDAVGNAQLAGALGHEGTHVADAQSEATRLAGKTMLEMNNLAASGGIMSRAVTEVHAYRVSAYIAAVITPSNRVNLTVNGNEIWNRGWRSPDAVTQREAGIRGALESPKGSYKYQFSSTHAISIAVPGLNNALDTASRWTVNGGPILQ